MEHKLRFIEKYVPDKCDLYLVGHSIGSKIISELLKDSAMSERLTVKRSVLLFPTLQKMRDTPNGKMFNFSMKFSYITIFLSWVRNKNFKKKSIFFFFLVVLFLRIYTIPSWITGCVFYIIFSLMFLHCVRCRRS